MIPAPEPADRHAGPRPALVRRGRALGSRLQLTVDAPPNDDQGDLEDAWAAVLAAFATSDAALSRFRDDSELARYNAAAGSGARLLVGRRLGTALAIADRARRVTDGRFDPALHAVLDALGEREAFRPEAVEPAAAPWPDPPVREVCAPARPLDLGGIGKGLALRWALAAAQRPLGDRAGALLECGGDLVAGGRAGSRWRVAIEDPAEIPGGEPLAVVELDAPGAIATSSVRVRRWDGPDGTPIHHLIDPRTSRPARTGLLAVTVRADDPAWAEVWTKALFLAGRDRIGEEARARGLAAWWVRADGRIGMTPGAREITRWAREDRLGG